MDNNGNKIMIVEKAVELFKKKGANNVTILEICRELDIPRSSFYYHFKTKEEVIDSYFLYSEVQITDHLIPLLASKSSYDQFIQIYTVLTDRTAESGPEIYSLIIRRFIEGHTKMLSPKNITMYDVYMSLLQKAQENNEIKNMLPPEKLIETILYLSLGLGANWCNKKGSFDFSQELIKLIDNYLQPN